MEHPRGIQPEGNLLLSRSGGNNCRNPGLGSLAVLNDAMVLEVLGLLSAQDLSRLSCASKACMCFCDHEDLWKACVIETFEGGFTWCGTWRDSYLASRPLANTQQDTQQGKEETLPRKRQRKGTSAQECNTIFKEKDRQKNCVRASNFYSDLLYQPWHCSTVDIPDEWLCVESVDRRKELTCQEFRAQYERHNLPVVLIDGAAEWPALKKWTHISYLRDAYGDRPVIAGNFEIPFSTYMSYAENTRDEMPLYLFDKTFANAASKLAGDFHVPEVFQEDLFSVLGEGRPDYRWLIAGPARSGSTFHIDPNSTSARNGVVCGAKKWILYPPGVVPPGVYPSVDGADVATSVSLIEWFLNFYDATKEGKVRPFECVVRPGEVIFVPRGWWHTCINLEWTVAVTQNFVSSCNLKNVVDFLRSGSSDLVSGCALEQRGSLHDRFLASLERDKPEVWQALQAEREVARQQNEKAKKLTALFKGTNTLALGKHADEQGNVTAESGAVQGGFKFGFL